MTRPRVTVILPTYNWATVLPYSIASVLDQTFTDFELLVIGDGCTDESAEVVQAIDDPRVRWHNLPANTGHQASPNNEGLHQARGSAIAYIGHDDLWLPRHLEVLLEALDAGAQLAFATWLDVYPGRRPQPWPPGPAYRYRPGDWIAPTSLVHERALIDRVGGWPTARETGDLDPESELWQRMAAASHPPVWVARLTSVKLPAAYRKSVYRRRPNYEQAYWLRRIRSAADPERGLTRPPSPWRALLARLRERPALPPSPQSAEQRRVLRRDFKGLPPLT